MTVSHVSSISTPTLFNRTALETYAYRRLGDSAGGAPPLLCLQHFTGTLDNWDPELVDAIAKKREVVLFDSAGIGRSTGSAPESVEGMASHAFAFVDALGLDSIDVLGFSLGGMVAQVMALQRPSLVRKMALVGTAPEGGEDIMHLDKPALQAIFGDPRYQGMQVLAGLFFTASESSQSAGRAFVDRLMLRETDRDPPSTAEVAGAQVAAFRKWESFPGDRFGKLGAIHQPTLVVNGVADSMISATNSYTLAERMPNAVLVTFPNAGHGALFQYRKTFARLLAEFLDTDFLET